MEAEYEELKLKYKKLLYEYSENTIIQSMNDMKSINQSQLIKIENLYNKIDQILDKNICAKTMLTELLHNISHKDLKCRLKFIEEIISNTLKIQY